ncbi:unnamed protein product [Acanthoscelides obtectus]|uniref:Histone-lysine N-methyltransferase SETMAR n=1 Tax=Acanthoscelides obtectus TaxID=200917 RepID=A0A9P0NY63_ACAOB|nr:unnamed protein product [Acanthoscelides obtectus]CAK1621151.1 hypothetical protein AOBTE_LOCUS792 [Acanthoscelides obtectus]
MSSCAHGFHIVSEIYVFSNCLLENVELLDHPPYSPDLCPNDFFTFPKIKNRLRGQRFQKPNKLVGDMR